MRARARAQRAEQEIIDSCRASRDEGQLVGLHGGGEFPGEVESDVVSDVLTPSRQRFEFGDNWRKFLTLLSEARIRDAELSLASMLGVDDLKGRSFLDVGSGSGLFSLAAARLHAGPFHSFDYDDDSVTCTAAVKAQFFPAKEDWTVERGDIADAAHCRQLGMFDVVYAWGVLHHTGAMWDAMENTCARVAPHGVLFLAIYNNAGPRSQIWLPLKRFYNRLPRPLRIPYAVLVSFPAQVRAIALATRRRGLGDYVRSWNKPKERGMSPWHDLIDWEKVLFHSLERGRAVGHVGRPSLALTRAVAFRLLRPRARAV